MIAVLVVVGVVCWLSGVVGRLVVKVVWELICGLDVREEKRV